MKNQFKVVMLPTNKAKLHIAPNNVAFKSNTTIKFKGCIPQHLYIVDVNAFIYIGDWVITKFNQLHQVKSNETYNVDGWIKVIASTDTSLDLPNLPEEFIKAYVENPNNGKVIYNDWVVGGEFYYTPIIKDTTLRYSPDKNNSAKEKPQVDFDLLKEFISHLGDGLTVSAQRENAILFFEMLGKSQSFAVKAHKELKNK